MSAPDIFTYMDYRKFLRDYYKHRKLENAAFSFETFARKAGFRSKSVLHNIMTGKRNLSKNAVFRVAEAMKLNEKALNYFKEMVAFSQSRTSREKSYSFHKLMEYNPRSPARTLQKDHYEFYSNWHYNTLRELISIIDFKEDYALLGKLLHPPIPASEAKRAVALLLRLGLVEKVKNRYVLTSRAVTTGDEVAFTASNDFHHQNMILADESIDAFPQLDRDISCVVVSLPRDRFEAMKHEIQTFRKRLMRLADESQRPTRIYHINFQMFPTTVELDPMRQKSGEGDAWIGPSQT